MAVVAGGAGAIGYASAQRLARQDAREVIATLEARPERETDVEAALRVLLTHSRQEPGNRRYDLYRDSTRPATFHLIEAYADEAALEAHRASAHYLRYREQAGAWLMAAPRVAVLDPVEVAGDE